VFGGLWAYIGVLALPPAWHLPATVAVVIATLLLIVLLWTTGGSAREGERLFTKRPYQFAVVAEVISIYLASLLLSRIGLQAYFIQVVGIIVGLHFIGLWAATRSPRFIYIAVGMCIVSTLAIFFPAVAGAVHPRDLLTGAGNGLVLWMCAARRSAV
jgi:hypothetical protein